MKIFLFKNSLSITLFNVNSIIKTLKDLLEEKGSQIKNSNKDTMNTF